jgi:hypothetical protein
MSTASIAKDTHEMRGKAAMKRMRVFLTKALVAAVVSVGVVAALAPAAQAQWEITNATGSNRINGQFSRQAGAHADLTNELDFTLGETPREVRVALPTGLVGNPTAIPTCTNVQLFEYASGKVSNCPIASQVGVAEVHQYPEGPLHVPVFNMAHGPDIPGLFALNYAGVLVSFVPRVVPEAVPGGYGIVVTVPPISQAEKVTGATVTFWGDPADESHFAERNDPNKNGPEAPGSGVKTTANNLPFMTNPTACTPTPLTTTMEASSWQSEGFFARRSFNSEADGTPYMFDRCDVVPFQPSVEVHAGTHRAASPSGLDVTIDVPQYQTPYGIASGDVKKTVVALPQGFSVSPSAVAGLGACSEAEIGLGDNTAPTCPDSSKIGNITIKTPLLTEPLEGEVILARQNENPFHSLFALYLVAKGPGFYLKLPGELNVDKGTGQVKTIFDDTPQLPFEELHLDFRGGPTAPLVTPETCGTYNTRSEITSWASDTPVVIDSPTIVDEDCAGKGGFSPTLQAGVANPVAGAQSPLTIRVRRLDGEQNLSRLEFKLPEGELASLKGVALCPEANAPSGNCPTASQVGISTTAIGTGAFPLFVPQPGKSPTALYLAGPYKGAPYSLITKVPAQSGPFDFGTIVVRTAINVDPNTTQVIAKSDPLPQILEGVPISYRDLRIEVQKPDFTVNPTSCEQRSVTSTIASVGGALAHPSVPFKVGDCASLKFKPKLALRLKGGTHRGDFPQLSATLTAGKGEANIARVAVSLPHSEFLEQGHIGTVCTRVQYAAKKCPAASIYGYATAYTPLLEQPLQGPVYLRSSNHTLPDLVAELNGQFDVELDGRIDSKNGGIRNTFETVPDAPVSKFVLQLKAGKKSLLVNSSNLCKAPARADVRMVGQNGMHLSESPKVQTPCGHKGKAKPKKGAHR